MNATALNLLSLCGLAGEFSLRRENANKVAGVFALADNKLTISAATSECVVSVVRWCAASDLSLSRCALNELILACPANDWRPPVRWFVIKKRGVVRVMSLVSLPALLAHLDSLSDDASEKPCSSEGELIVQESGAAAEGQEHERIH